MEKKRTGAKIYTPEESYLAAVRRSVEESDFDGTDPLKAWICKRVVL